MIFVLHWPYGSRLIMALIGLTFHITLVIWTASFSYGSNGISMGVLKLNSSPPPPTCISWGLYLSSKCRINSIYIMLEADIYSIFLLIPFLIGDLGKTKRIQPIISSSHHDDLDSHDSFLPCVIVSLIKQFPISSPSIIDSCTSRITFPFTYSLESSILPYKEKEIFSETIHNGFS